MNDKVEEVKKAESELISSTEEFKNNATRSDRRKRLKFFYKQYKEHMNKLDSVSPESFEDEEKLNKFVGKHIQHTNILKTYIYSFIPKHWDKQNLIFADKKIYYNGKEL